jgi:hypothetical protein
LRKKNANGRQASKNLSQLETTMAMELAKSLSSAMGQLPPKPAHRASSFLPFSIHSSRSAWFRARPLLRTSLEYLSGVG